MRTAHNRTRTAPTDSVCFRYEQRTLHFALMEQQVDEASKLGVSAMQLGVNSEVEIVSSAPMLLFGSPESWLLNEKWRQLLSNMKDLVGIVVDEVHLIYKWGQGEKGGVPFVSALPD
ncbi:hypothetical protein WMY93_032853 [Mugilogobius chulae]|uniref:Helicase ATP-binding domain-containing protein n=1 Tax=Mugilogobius chulae TaxID=88201 RepID=A0AAW0MMU8_9GOBI